MKNNIKLGLFAASLLFSMTTSAQVLKSVSVEQVDALQKQHVLLIDVREDAEYVQSHVAGSVLIPLGQLPNRLAELGNDPSRPIALICRSGNRSGKAQKILEQAGFTATKNVEGGMLEWEKSGLPVQKGAAALVN